jgi:hypothetical protein
VLQAIPFKGLRIASKQQLFSNITLTWHYNTVPEVLDYFLFFIFLNLCNTRYAPFRYTHTERSLLGIFIEEIFFNVDCAPESALFVSEKTGVFMYAMSALSVFHMKRYNTELKIFFYLLFASSLLLYLTETGYSFQFM